MEIGTLLVLLIVAFLVTYVISKPFFETPPPPKEPPAAGSRREALLNTLQDLDFDHNLGKIPEDEYARQRAALLVALEQLDRQGK